MTNLVFFGPPGSGKGTQASLISKEYGLVHLSTGELFRSNIKNQTELGKQAQGYISKGHLVPDSLTISLLKDAMEHNNCSKGIIFDGFPRTTDQAIVLDQLLQEKNTEIHLVIGLEVDNETLIKRILERGTISGRSDDLKTEVIEERIKTYESETKPVKTFYCEQNKYHNVSGIGSIEDITSNIKRFIEHS